MAELREARTTRRGWAALGFSLATHLAIVALMSLPATREPVEPPLDSWGSQQDPVAVEELAALDDLVDVDTTSMPGSPPATPPVALPPAPAPTPEPPTEIPEASPPPPRRPVLSTPRRPASPRPTAKTALSATPEPDVSARRAVESAPVDERDEFWWATPESATAPPSKPRSPSLNGQPPPVATRASDARDEVDDEAPARDVGLPPGVKRLVSAFTRSIPYYNHADPAWDRLPLGKVGSMDLTFIVDDHGRIVEVVTRGRPPPVLLRVRKRSVFALERGRFAISPGEVRAGTQTLRVECFLSQRPIGKFVPPAFHFTPPRKGHPGTAAVHLESGRYVEMRVTPDPE